MTTSPSVRGWCPGAWRPMATGDGLLVRVRPDRGRLTRAQGLALCDAAETWGSGLIELTRRANLQLRGVTEADWPTLMAFLVKHGLVDPNAEVERRPALMLTPDWRDGDASQRAASLLVEHFATWPRLPDKWGLAIDAGPEPVLNEASADLRLERSGEGGLLVRVDGRDLGIPVDDVEAAVALMRRLAHWFVDNGGIVAGRMQRFTAALPEWAPAVAAPAVAAPAVAAPATTAPCPGLVLGAHPRGRVVGLPFGRAAASVLRAALFDDGITGIRVTPWRRLLLEGAGNNEKINDSGELSGALIHDEGDTRLAMDVCPGAPYCAQASVATLRLADQLSARLDQASAGRQASERGSDRIHISGCAKGCARGRSAEFCLTGRDGHYDLILGGRADDTPVATDLSETEALELISRRWAR